jgi:hypothetical protein
VSDPTTTATDWETRARTAEARVEELTAERARLWDELHVLRAERRSDEYFRSLTGYMKRSVSWRITWPLRAAKRLAIKVVRALNQGG